MIFLACLVFETFATALLENIFHMDMYTKQGNTYHMYARSYTQLHIQHIKIYVTLYNHLIFLEISLLRRALKHVPRSVWFLRRKLEGHLELIENIMGHAGADDVSWQRACNMYNAAKRKEEFPASSAAAQLRVG